MYTGDNGTNSGFWNGGNTGSLPTGNAASGYNQAGAQQALHTITAAAATGTTGTTGNWINDAWSAAHPGLVNPDSGSASDKLGAIAKAQWTDYQNRFVPIENQLMQQTTYMNPNLAGQEMGKAEADTAKTYDNIAGTSAIQLGRYGMSMTGDQQASSDRLNALGKSGAIVDAANNIRLKLVERNQSIASGAANPSMTKQG